MSTFIQQIFVQAHCQILSHQNTLQQAEFESMSTHHATFHAQLLEFLYSTILLMFVMMQIHLTGFGLHELWDTATSVMTQYVAYTSDAANQGAIATVKTNVSLWDLGNLFLVSGFKVSIQGQG